MVSRDKIGKEIDFQKVLLKKRIFERTHWYELFSAFLPLFGPHHEEAPPLSVAGDTR